MADNENNSLYTRRTIPSGDGIFWNQGKTRVLQEGLRALIREKAAERIRMLGGSDKKAKPVPRRQNK